MERELICIVCPKGCNVKIISCEQGGFDVSGNHCKKGEAYAVEECTHPERTVTTVVHTDSLSHPYLPVKSSARIPIKSIHIVLSETRRFKAVLPVKRGDILIQNCAGSGADIIATRSISA